MAAKIKLLNINGKDYKQCTSCGDAKPLSSNYYSKGKYSDGTNKYRSECKSCISTKADIRYQSISSKPKAALGRRQSSYRYTLKKLYNLTEVDYNKIHECQGGKCLICTDALSNVFNNKEGKQPAIDHCHDTGKVRGILCKKCNSGIGLLSDSIFILEKAISYLRGEHEEDII